MLAGLTMPFSLAVLVSVGKVGAGAGRSSPRPPPQTPRGADPQQLFALQMYVVMSWQSHRCDYSSMQILLMKLCVPFVWLVMLN